MIHDLYLQLLAQLESGDFIARSMAESIVTRFGQELEKAAIALEQRTKRRDVSTAQSSYNGRYVSAMSNQETLKVRMTPIAPKSVEVDTSGRQGRRFWPACSGNR